jgi:hypothetical protein
MEHRALSRPLKIAALALLCAAVATPCSFDTMPVLFYEVRPDWPIDQYVDGHLGIVQPTYARSHLVVAFRYLSGNPPSAVEREAFRELLRHRLHEYPDGARPADPVEQWERLRTTIRGVEYKWPPNRERAGVDTYDSYTNCTDDAFATASATLALRMKTFGAMNPAVLRWLDAQETVFANCSGGEARVPAYDPSLPAVLRADRRYQIAAANFYALRYDDARAQFLAVAGDKDSPWQKTARLVATRILIRAENLGVPVHEADPLAIADEELRAILADASMKSMHDAAWDLLAVTTFRRDPEQRLRDAVKGITGGETSARRVRTHFADYTILLDKDVKGDDELTDWITTFQSGNAAHALERWQATKKTHWLVAALTHVKPDDPAVASLLEASSSTAEPSVVHHRARLQLAAGRDDEVRTELDRALARDIAMSARNQLLAQRRGVARTLAEFLRNTPAKPVGEGQDVLDPQAARPELPPDAAVVLNYWMPLKTLQFAVKDDTLPAEIRDPLKRAVTTRAALLEKPTFETAYLIVQDDDRKPYVDALDGGYLNWWCKGGSRVDADVANATPLPPFLSATSELADAENDKLRALGSGATWILRTALARAKSHPNDERVPEALSLAILGTRSACGDDDTANLAKEAFGVLHRKYGKTTWAAETPYWYRPW